MYFRFISSLSHLDSSFTPLPPPPDVINPFPQEEEERKKDK